MSFIVLGILNSCSKNDLNNSSSNSNNNNVLVKKMVQVDSNNNTRTSTFQYVGKKLLSESTTDSSTNSTKVVSYTYANDLIVHSYSTSNNGDSTSDYLYDSYNRLISGTTTSVSSGSITGSFNLIYNPDGTVKFIDNNVLQYAGYDVFTISNGNIIKNDHYSIGNVLQYENIFNYDNKNNPFINITGLHAFIFTYECLTFGYNNYLNKQTTYTAPGTTLGPGINNTYSNYNANNFPVTVISTSYSSSGGVPNSVYTPVTTSITYYYE